MTRMDSNQDDQSITKPTKEATSAVALSISAQRRSIGILLGIGILLLVAILLMMTKSTEKIYGQVGRYKVTEAAVSTLAKENPSLSKDTIVTTLLDLNLYRQAGATVGVTVTSDEVTQETNKRVGSEGVSYKKYLAARVESDMLQQRLTAPNTRQHPGESSNYPFPPMEG